MAAKKSSTRIAKKPAKKPAKKAVKKVGSRAAAKSVGKLARKPARKAARKSTTPAPSDTTSLLAALARQSGLSESVVLERALSAFAAASGFAPALVSAPVVQPPSPAPEAPEQTYPDDSHLPALGPDVRLYVHPPGRPPQEMIADTFVIGASSRCDLTLKYPTVEMRHVRIVREGRRYFAEDLDTTKGTVIHGNKITRYELAHEDDMYLAGFLKVRVYLLE